MASGTRRLFEAGDTFSRYRVVKLLGEGAFGEVYEGLHIDLDKRVAIKTLKPEHARMAEARARFLQEGRSAAKIHHPNVVEVFDVGVHEGIFGEVPYLVMEFLRGDDLGAHLRAQRFLSPSETLEIMVPVCAAVMAAHEEGVIHRDLKPANIHLGRTRDGTLQPKVLDFGIARVMGENSQGPRTSAGKIMGSPGYMSPEQTRGATLVTAASDQYTLGAIVYECVVGRCPFEDDSIFALIVKVGTGMFSPPREVNPSVPEALESVILRAMSLESRDRYASVRDFARALLAFADARTLAIWSPVLRGADPTNEMSPMLDASTLLRIERPSAPGVIPATAERSSRETPTHVLPGSLKLKSVVEVASHAARVSAPRPSVPVKSEEEAFLAAGRASEAPGSRSTLGSSAVVLDEALSAPGLGRPRGNLAQTVTRVILSVVLLVGSSVGIREYFRHGAATVPTAMPRASEVVQSQRRHPMATRDVPRAPVSSVQVARPTEPTAPRVPAPAPVPAPAGVPSRGPAGVPSRGPAGHIARSPRDRRLSTQVMPGVLGGPHDSSNGSTPGRTSGPRDQVPPAVCPNGICPVQK